MADRAPITYDEFIAEQQSAQIPFEVGGRTFHIVPPELMSDEDAEVFFELMGKAEGDDGYDIVRLARTMVDDYDGFAAAGGTALGLIGYMDRLNAAKTDELQRGQGVTEGEGEAS